MLARPMADERASLMTMDDDGEILLLARHQHDRHRRGQLTPDEVADAKAAYWALLTRQTDAPSESRARGAATTGL